MKAMVVLALAFLPVVSLADVVIEEPRHPRPTPPPTTTTAATTTTTTTPATTTVAPTTTHAPAPAPAQAAAIPEKKPRRYPLAMILSLGVVLTVVLAARRGRARRAQ